jgi:hypothetical protein
MMVDTVAGILITALVVAAMTTLVLPGRQTASVVTAGGNAFSKIINSSIGRG